MNFKNVSGNWQVWVNVFTDMQEMVLEGKETDCKRFLINNDANASDKYGSVFTMAPHTGRNEDFSKFAC